MGNENYSEEKFYFLNRRSVGKLQRPQKKSNFYKELVKNQEALASLQRENSLKQFIETGVNISEIDDFIPRCFGV